MLSAQHSPFGMHWEITLRASGMRCKPCGVHVGLALILLAMLFLLQLSPDELHFTRNYWVHVVNFRGHCHEFLAGGTD